MKFFSFEVPNDLIQQEVHCIDSLCGIWEDENLVLQIEYGPYAVSTEFRELDFLKSHRIIVDDTWLTISQALNNKYEQYGMIESEARGFYIGFTKLGIDGNNHLSVVIFMPKYSKEKYSIAIGIINSFIFNPK